MQGRRAMLTEVEMMAVPGQHEYIAHDQLKSHYESSRI
jgi:hypothetical protein